GPARTRERRGAGAGRGCLRLLVQLRELPQLHAEHRRGSHDRGGHEPLEGQGTPGQERRVRRQDHREGPEPRDRVEHGRRRRDDLGGGSLRGDTARSHTRGSDDELLRPARRQGRGGRGERPLEPRADDEGGSPELRQDRRARRARRHGEPGTQQV
ncbi:MAG: hypothetical protein AVDCRST_MAG78-2336, partial [uncultured Rubrobacteraceae bacterium]